MAGSRPVDLVTGGVSTMLAVTHFGFSTGGAGGGHRRGQSPRRRGCGERR